MTQNQEAPARNPNIGLVVAGGFGIAATAIVVIATPLVLPALRKHCLPYVPATDNQLGNLAKAFAKHSKHGDRFVDIGSGDGRVCRLANQMGIFSHVHGVELNSMLVLYSRYSAVKTGHFKKIEYFRQDLWKFPFNRYQAVCIFGVESMMDPLKVYLTSTCSSDQIVYACRFPFKDCKAYDEIGTGIDTVWVYKLAETSVSNGSGQ